MLTTGIDEHRLCCRVETKMLMFVYWRKLPFVSAKMVGNAKYGFWPFPTFSQKYFRVNSKKDLVPPPSWQRFQSICIIILSVIAFYSAFSRTPPSPSRELSTTTMIYTMIYYDTIDFSFMLTSSLGVQKLVLNCIFSCHGRIARDLG